MSARLHECRLLIGEADSFERARLECLAASWGYAVESLADGETALARLAAPEPPAVALLDFDLPGMDCLGISKALKNKGGVPAVQLRQSSRSPVNFPDSAKNAPATWIVGLVHPEKKDGLACFTGGLFRSVLGAEISDILVKPVHEWELRFRLQTAQRAQMRQREFEQSIEAANLQALHDPLTGLWTRDAVLQLLAHETDRAKRERTALSLILIDLDEFSQRNVEFGYKACDSVLQQIATRLRRDLRSYDILGRSGEDEFLIVLPGCGFDDAVFMAERLRRQALRKPFKVNGESIPLHASFGVSESRGRLPLLALREAERALVAAKLAGRDRVLRFSTKLLENAAMSEFNRGRIAASSSRTREIPQLLAPAAPLPKLRTRKP